MAARMIVGLLAACAAAVDGSATAAQSIGGEAAACAPGGGPAIRVEAVGLKDRTGALKLELYPATKADFLADDRVLLAAGKTFRRVRAAMPPTGPVILCIRVPRPGTYALLFTHDRDGKNKFNFWLDGAGIPGNTRLGRARPRLADATVTVGAGAVPVVIRVQYLRGFPPAFAPLRK